VGGTHNNGNPKMQFVRSKACSEEKLELFKKSFSYVKEASK
jgi:hypothetical protein